MATLLRDIERPSILDRPSAPEPAPLSERLRAERVAMARGAPSATSPERAGSRRGGEATLDELLVGAWEGLSAHRPVACPVCAGPMVPRDQVGGGACGDCGSHLR